MKKPVLFLQVLVLFIWDFMVAITQVASWVFRPNRKMQSVIVVYPLTARNETALWFLALIISLTPGSLVLGLASDHSYLHLHFFNAPDPEAAMEHIRTRFENRLVQLFPNREGLR